MNHTQEPWEVVDSRTIRGSYEHGNPEKLGLLVAELPAFRSPEDARRIVACVNACAGISTGFLELIVCCEFTQMDMLDFFHVKQQRDELLAALEGAEKAIRKAITHLPPDSEAVFCGEWLDEIVCAITKAKGGAA